jgi:hypothetical protein
MNRNKKTPLKFILKTLLTHSQQNILVKIRAHFIAIRDILFSGDFKKKPKLITKSYSQVGQESFVAYINNFKQNGYFVEIGAGSPVQNSNTHYLNTQLGWNGISIDINSEYEIEFMKFRTNDFISADATEINYESILNKHKFPNFIDYLQVDINPAENSLKALKKIPFNKFKFRAITYEHDSYVNEYHNDLKAEARELLLSNGYTLVAKDVSVSGYAFEDWWIHRELLDNEHLIAFWKSGKNGLSLFSRTSQLRKIISDVF